MPLITSAIVAGATIGAAVGSGAAFTAAGLAVGAGIGAGAGIAIKSGMKSNKGDNSPLPMPESPAGKQGDMAAAAAKSVQDTRRSATKTVYTSPLGVQDQAAVARKSLLGQ